MKQKISIILATDVAQAHRAIEIFHGQRVYKMPSMLLSYGYLFIVSAQPNRTVIRDNDPIEKMYFWASAKGQVKVTDYYDIEAVVCVDRPDLYGKKFGLLQDFLNTLPSKWKQDIIKKRMEVLPDPQFNPRKHQDELFSSIGD